MLTSNKTRIYCDLVQLSVYNTVENGIKPNYSCHEKRSSRVFLSNEHGGPINGNLTTLKKLSVRQGRLTPTYQTGSVIETRSGPSRRCRLS